MRPDLLPVYNMNGSDGPVPERVLVSVRPPDLGPPLSAFFLAFLSPKFPPEWPIKLWLQHSRASLAQSSKLSPKTQGLHDQAHQSNGPDPQDPDLYLGRVLYRNSTDRKYV